VYRLGCVLYESLTGRIPFERDSEVAKIYAHLNDPPPTVTATLADAPLELDVVVQRAMAKRRQDRYPSAGSLGRAAVAAAQRRAPTAPEQSVATGAAAPTALSPAAGAAAPTVPAERATTAAQAPPEQAPTELASRAAARSERVPLAQAPRAQPLPAPAQPPPAQVGAGRPAPPAAPPPEKRRSSPSLWALLGIVAAIVLVGGAVVLTDGLSTGSDKREALGRDEFATKAIQICRDLEPEAKAANRQITSSNSATVRAGYDSSRATLSELRARLRSLGPPAGLTSDYRAYIGLFDDYLSVSESEESALLTGDTRRLERLRGQRESLEAQSRRYASRLGLSSPCP
jgi:hypothetical protein